MNGNDKNESTHAELRKRAEKQARNNADWFKSNDPDELSHLALRSILHELHIHQIELEMQNEELLRSHVEIDASRARYFDLFELAPVGYFTVDDEGLVLEVNLCGTKLLGLPKTEIVGQPFSRFIAYDDQDIYYLHRKKQLQPGEPRICELRMKCENGKSALWVQLETSLVADHRGKIACRLVISDISTLKDSQATLDRKLEEQRMLLCETHHRIKNNIVSIISLLSMQSRATKNPEAISSLNETIGRLELMAQLYEKMLLSGKAGTLELGSYLGDIADTIVRLFSLNTEISISTQFDSIMLESDTVFSLGIIINELVTNAMKYAFEGRKDGSIQLSAIMKEGKLSLKVHDDGIGLPKDFDTTKQGGFGLRLVNLLADQLGGSFSMEASGGTLCTLVFPV